MSSADNYAPDERRPPQPATVDEAIEERMAEARHNLAWDKYLTWIRYGGRRFPILTDHEGDAKLVQAAFEKARQMDRPYFDTLDARNGVTGGQDFPSVLQEVSVQARLQRRNEQLAKELGQERDKTEQLQHAVDAANNALKAQRMAGNSLVAENNQLRGERDAWRRVATDLFNIFRNLEKSNG